MTSLLRSLFPPSRMRASWPTNLGIDEYIGMLKMGSLNQTLTGNREEVDANFAGLVHGAYRSNGVIFACMLTRFMLFSEARFQFQRMRNGRPGDLFSTPDLALLEHPEPGKTTGDLLARAITDVDLAGNYFVTRRPGRLKRLRPDWTWMILGSEDADVRPYDIDAEVVGYVFKPGGLASPSDPITLARDEVAHFAPIPDPLASYRGMSWLTPIVREMQADSAATLHKLKFFENGATPNMIVTLDKGLTIEKAREWIELFDQEHDGVMNAYRTVYLGGGADAEVVGANLQQLDFKQTQGAGETRIAAAAGVHPTIVGLSEGMQGSSLNTGNFGAAKRLTGDKTLRPLWRNLAGSLEVIIPTPSDARLWYDDRDIPFLKDDIKDAAEVVNFNATGIRTLTDGGYTPESVVAAVTSGDLTQLTHAGYLPVQVQPIQADAAAESDPTIARTPIPQLTAGPATFEVRCTGTRKDGQPCNALIGKRPGPDPVGFESKCDRCGTLVAA